MFILLLVLRIAQLCFARDSHDPYSFPVTLRPEFRHSDGRPFIIPQLFEPNHEVTHYTANTSEYSNPRRLLNHTWKHDTHRYVNLELLEQYISKGGVRCDPAARPNVPTRLVAFFEYEEAYELTKATWHSDDPLLFVVEGEKCLEGPSSRSVYESTGIEFNDTQRRVTINALPIRAKSSVVSSWAASHSFGHVVVPPEFYPEPRPSTGLQWIANGIGDQSKRQVDIDVKKIPLNIVIPGSIAVACSLVGFAPCAALGFVGVGIGAVVKPSEFDIEGRFNASLGKRKEWTLPFGDTGEDPSGPHLGLPAITVACLDCHAQGHFEAGFNLEFDLGGHHKEKKPGCPARKLARSDQNPLNSRIQTQHEAFMELTRRAKHQKLEEVRLSKRAPEECRSGIDCDYDIFDEAPKCSFHDHNWPHCQAEELKTQFDQCGEDNNPLLHPLHAIGDSIKCIWNSAVHNSDCWNDFVEAGEEFEGPEDYIQRFIKTHVKEAEAYFIVHETIELQWQNEVYVDFAAGLWFDADFYPAPTGFAVVPSFGYFLSEGPGSQVQSIPPRGEWANRIQEQKNGVPLPYVNDPERRGGDYYDPENKKPGVVGPGDSPHQGWGTMPWALTPLRVEATVSTALKMNLTLPGFKLRVEKGGELRVRPLEEDKVVNSLNVTAEYLEASIHVGNDSSLTFSLSVGPALDFTLIPKYGISEGLSEKGIGSPLSFGGHWQWARLDLVIKEALADNPICLKEYEDFEGGVTVGLYFRHGCLVYGSFFGARIDGSWLGKLQDEPFAIPGLFWSKRIFEKCYKLPKEQRPGEFISNLVNGWMHELQAPLHQIFAMASDILSGDDGTPNANQSSTIEGGSYNQTALYLSPLEQSLFTFLNDRVFGYPESEQGIGSLLAPPPPPDPHMQSANAALIGASTTSNSPTATHGVGGTVKSATAVLIGSSVTPSSAVTTQGADGSLKSAQCVLIHNCK